MAILGLGVCRPEGSISQADAAAAASARCCRSERESRLLRALYRQAGVSRRGSVLLPAGDNGRALAAIDAYYAPPNGEPSCGPGVAPRMRTYMERAPRLAEAAIRDALAASGCEPGEVDQLVVVSCTGLASPGLDTRLIGRLGLRADVGRTMIGFMGCHGAINGLRVAAAFAAATPGSTVLLACVELCSLHFQYGWDAQQIVANALFADGAAAVVGRCGEREGAWRLGATGSCLLPDSLDDMTWVIGDHGFRMTLSPRVPGLIGEHLRPWFEAWLGAQGLSIGGVNAWAIHPGGPRIVDAAEAALGLEAGASWASREVLAADGNMSSPTVLFLVDRLRAAGAEPPCVLLAFGPGLVAEAALLL